MPWPSASRRDRVLCTPFCPELSFAHSTWRLLVTAEHHCLHDAKRISDWPRNLSIKMKVGQTLAFASRGSEPQKIHRSAFQVEICLQGGSARAFLSSFFCSLAGGGSSCGTCCRGNHRRNPNARCAALPPHPIRCQAGRARSRERRSLGEGRSPCCTRL